MGKYLITVNGIEADVMEADNEEAVISKVLESSGISILELEK